MGGFAARRWDSVYALHGDKLQGDQAMWHTKIL